jgi:adenylate kinase
MVTAGARLVILGKQGAGTSTQAVRLGRHFLVPHVSTGDTFRAAVQSRKRTGREVRRRLDSGELVSDHIARDKIEKRFDLTGNEGAGRGTGRAGQQAG